MADRHAAAVKAWKKRRRAQQGDKKETVQLRNDYAREAASLSSANVLPLVKPSSGPERSDEIADQAKVVSMIGRVVGKYDVPEAALDGLRSIEVSAQWEMAVHIGPDGKKHPFVGMDVDYRDMLGDYQGAIAKVRISAMNFANKKIAPWDKRDPNEVIEDSLGKTLFHEIGHHAHQAKLTNEAAAEWEEISQGGTTCLLGQYGRTNTTEHFAEAFAAFARRGEHHAGYQKSVLEELEPEAYAFMERLWKTPSMWKPRGQAKFVARRNG